MRVAFGFSLAILLLGKAAFEKHLAGTLPALGASQPLFSWLLLGIGFVPWLRSGSVPLPWALGQCRLRLGPPFFLPTVPSNLSSGTLSR